MTWTVVPPKMPQNLPQTPTRSVQLRTEHLEFRALFPPLDIGAMPPPLSLLSPTLAHGESTTATAAQLAEHVDFFDTNFQIVERMSESKFSCVFLVSSANSSSSPLTILKRVKCTGSQTDRAVKLREIEILSELGGHPNIVSLFYAWEQSLVLNLQLEYHANRSLDYFISRNSVSTLQMRSFILDIARALKHIHQHSIIHFDVKPSNIFVTDSLTCRVGDFGLSVHISDLSSTKSSKPIELQEGDRVYMAPELLDNNYGQFNDIFSFGLTILQMITNCSLPHYGSEWIRLRENDFSQVPPVDGDFAQLLNLVCTYMCCADYTLRITASDVLHKLERF